LRWHLPVAKVTTAQLELLAQPERLVLTVLMVLTVLTVLTVLMALTVLTVLMALTPMRATCRHCRGTYRCSRRPISTVTG
jgi:hypothetical protein